MDKIKYIKCKRCPSMVEVKLSYRGAKLNSKYCKKCVKIVRKERVVQDQIYKKQVSLVYIKIKEYTNKSKLENVRDAGTLLLQHLQLNKKERKKINEDKKKKQEFMKKMYEKYKEIDKHHQEIVLRYLRWEE